MPTYAALRSAARTQRTAVPGTRPRSAVRTAGGVEGGLQSDPTAAPRRSVAAPSPRTAAALGKGRGRGAASPRSPRPRHPPPALGWGGRGCCYGRAAERSRSGGFLFPISPFISALFPRPSLRGTNGARPPAHKGRSRPRGAPHRRTDGAQPRGDGMGNGNRRSAPLRTAPALFPRRTAPHRAARSLRPRPPAPQHAAPPQTTPAPPRAAPAALLPLPGSEGRGPPRGGARPAAPPAPPHRGGGGGGMGGRGGRGATAGGAGSPSRRRAPWPRRARPSAPAHGSQRCRPPAPRRR